ncbi:MAG: tetratricopeptide repeat protein [Pseudomonadota bacterium]
MDARLLEAQALLRQGNVQLAEILLRQLTAQQPRLAPAWSMLGALAAHKGNLDEAASLLERSLAMDPSSADTHFRLGVLRHELGRWEGALVAFEESLRLRPGTAAVLNLRGVALKNLGRVEEALASYDAALAAQPDSVEALHNRAVACRHLARWDDSIASAERALALRPRSAELHNHLGMVLHESGRLDGAVACFETALQLAPDSAETLMNLGVSLYEQYRFGPALAALDRALALAPGHVDVLFNRANVLVELDRFDEAIAAFGKVREQRPRDVGLLMNIANALRDQHRFDAALGIYEEALAVSADDAGVNWNRALCLLTRGDFERGWAAYEWRFRAGKLGHAQRSFDMPRWTGSEDLQGRSILVHAEQGLGDTIEMARYARVLAAKGARVILEAQKPLLALLHGVEGAAGVVAPGANARADFHCPMLSLPCVLGTRRDTIPSPQGVLRRNEEHVARWGSAIAQRAGTGPGIGLVWSGNPGYAGDRRRSLALREFRYALPPGPRYWRLQKDVSAADAPWLAGDPPIERFEEDDFIHTAAQIAALDLVVTVDTSILHLAGTVGTPTWLLLPFTADFRWATDTESTPWYPGVKLFRQERAGDWAPVLARVRDALSSL